jgi:hypothetical protein
MSKRLLPPLAIVALAATLWVVPSIGSQGMGTLGERVWHADRSLIDRDGDAVAITAKLRSVDARVEAAIAR